MSESGAKDVRFELSREEFRELLLMVGIGDFIRGAVIEARENNPGNEGELFMKLMRTAFKHGLPEARRHDEHVDASDDFMETQMDFIEEYNDEEFWNELERRLGKRDFEREVNADDLAYMKKSGGWLPERIYEYYQKYSDEFEAFGIDRLEISKDAPVSDIRDAL